jgi:uncharacterized DUF497 family protein
MLYIWDEAKRAANLAKHGVDFAAAECFDWETARVSADLRRAYGEPRMVALGKIGSRLHVMVFTRRAGKVRIISLRKANNREMWRYEEFA